MRKVEMIGRRFGRLVVVKEAKPAIHGNGKPRLRYVATCDCGGRTTVQGGNLRNGNTRSCGCIEIKPPCLFRVYNRKRAT
jgi:hypothetical protein